MGTPAWVIDEVGPDQADMMVWAKAVYVDLARRYPLALKKITREKAGGG